MRTTNLDINEMTGRSKSLKRMPSNRRCKHCSTLLSRFNKNVYCFVHSYIGIDAAIAKEDEMLAERKRKADFLRINENKRYYQKKKLKGV